MRRRAAGWDAAPARAVDATALPGGRGCPAIEGACRLRREMSRKNGEPKPGLPRLNL